MADLSRLEFRLPGADYERLAGLPWSRPLADWPALGVWTLRRRVGEGRHPIHFVEAGGERYAIKELAPALAERELRTFEFLAEHGIPALTAVGLVVRENRPELVASPVGPPQQVREITACLVTRLAGDVLPEAEFFGWALRPENRRKVWDAAADLFVGLHAAGIYWGDPSPANLLIRFRRDDPTATDGRRELALQAIMADAETVERRPAPLDPTLAEADLSHFEETMWWVEEDVRWSGRKPAAAHLADEIAALRLRYEAGMAAVRAATSFERQTALQPDLLGPLRGAGQVAELMRNVEEHKWYLSEQQGAEVRLEQAARDWYDRVFSPVRDAVTTRLVAEQRVGAVEPDAAELYVAVMRHKYVLSQQLGRDVGLTAAIEDFCRRLAAPPVEPPDSVRRWNRLRTAAWLRWVKAQAAVYGRLATIRQAIAPRRPADGSDDETSPSGTAEEDVL